jgi:hypothetical protein
MSRLGHIDLNMLDGAVAGKDDSAHRCHDVPLIEIGARTHDGPVGELMNSDVPRLPLRASDCGPLAIGMVVHI